MSLTTEIHLLNLFLEGVRMATSKMYIQQK